MKKNVQMESSKKKQKKKSYLEIETAKLKKQIMKGGHLVSLAARAFSFNYHLFRKPFLWL